MDLNLNMRYVTHAFHVQIEMVWDGPQFGHEKRTRKTISWICRLQCELWTWHMWLLRQCWPRISHNASGSRGRLQHCISGLVETCRPNPLRSTITSASVRSITTNECRLSSITRAFKVATDSDQTVTPEKKHLTFFYYAVHYTVHHAVWLESGSWLKDVMDFNQFTSSASLSEVGVDTYNPNYDFLDYRWTHHILCPRLFAGQ